LSATSPSIFAATVIITFDTDADAEPATRQRFQVRLGATN
jgi:hypothetical protein